VSASSVPDPDFGVGGKDMIRTGVRTDELTSSGRVEERCTVRAGAQSVEVRVARVWEPKRRSQFSLNHVVNTWSVGDWDDEVA